MSKNKRILIGLATCWPLVAAVLFYGALFISIFSAVGSFHGNGPDFPGGWFTFAAILIITTLVWIIVLLVGYIGHVYRNGQIESTMKLVWAVLIFFGNIFAMPIYWYIYIWRDPS